MTTDEKKPFILLLGMGEVCADDIDDFIDRWHEGFHEDKDQTLHDFLGMTWEEYGGWVEQRLQLPDIAVRAMHDYVTEKVTAGLEAAMTAPMGATAVSVGRVKAMIRETLVAQDIPPDDAVVFVRISKSDERALQCFQGNRQDLLRAKWHPRSRKVDGTQWHYRIVAILKDTEEVVLRKERWLPLHRVWESSPSARVESVYELTDLYKQEHQAPMKFITARYTVDTAFWDTGKKNKK